MKRTAAFFLMITCGFCAIALAEIPFQRPEELKAHASHIVTGDVRSICTEVVRDDEWVRTSGVVEIRVTGREKGDRIEPGDCVYARFWNLAWIGKGPVPPHGSGHQVPKKGEAVRAYLERKDGGYEALLPNGFETISRGPAPKSKP